LLATKTPGYLTKTKITLLPTERITN
jgi:hypothetical protein